MTEVCEFCTEVQRRPSRFSQLYGRVLSTRILTETEHFVVLPSLGQLGVAHLLLVSRDHATAVSNLSQELSFELAELTVEISSYLARRLGSEVIVFENGDPMGVGNVSCSISHLHVHVVAVKDIGFAFRRSIQHLEPRCIGGLSELRRCQHAYTYLRFTERGWLIDQQLRSQAIRRLIAKNEGSAIWDWRDVGQERQLIEIVNFMRGDLATGVLRRLALRCRLPNYREAAQYRAQSGQMAA
jgi:diadenosine tetraphosphate (Ap4A) HIT family hydrolase